MVVAVCCAVFYVPFLFRGGIANFTFNYAYSYYGYAVNMFVYLCVLLILLLVSVSANKKPTVHHTTHHKQPQEIPPHKQTKNHDETTRSHTRYSTNVQKNLQDE
jgi:uncharacterized membrane protein